MITGQFMTFDYGHGLENKSKKRIVAVFGLLAFPDDHPLKDSHQYPVLGVQNDGPLAIDWLEGIDRTKEVQGHTVAGCLTLPIWKV